MAARRLIAVLVVLLVVSSIAAALAPEARRPETTTTEPTAPNSQPGPDTEDPDEPKPVPEEELPTGKLVERTVAVGTGTAGAQQEEEGKEPKPPAIEVTVGDRLALEVTSDDTAGIEIPDFGLLETASAGSPARFDMLMREAGTFTVRVVDGPTVAEIAVSEPVVATSKPDAGKPAPDQGGDGQQEQQPQQSEIEPAPETAA